MEEILLTRNGHDIRVNVSMTDSLTRKYRAIARYRGYEDSIASIHDDKNKNLAVEGSINKLLTNASPEILDLI